MKINNFIINEFSPVFIIAELSANHNGDKNLAFETVKAVKRAGANAIKLQTYTADTLTINSTKEDFVIKSDSIWDGKTYYELYRSAYTPWEWHKELFQLANDLGLICFSSPFDKSAVDLLEQLNSPAYKIASFEITDIPLIEYTASKGKPIILSTGIANDSDIKLALNACKKVGNNQIALLKCTSSYPAPINEANLLMIQDYKDKYNVITGLSDHTIGSIAPIVATVLGAKIIEKHFIIDRSIGGPDSTFSMNEIEFTQMVKDLRNAEKSIGKINYNLTSKQLKSKNFSRSLYIVSDMKKGDILTEKNLKSIRPGYGLHPKYYKSLIGKKVNMDIEKGTQMNFLLIDKEDL